MGLASAAALGPIRSRNPQLDYWSGRSAAKVLEVFHQPLEAIISLRRYMLGLSTEPAGLTEPVGLTESRLRCEPAIAVLGRTGCLGAAVAAEAAARTSASERAIFELVNMACLP